MEDHIKQFDIIDTFKDLKNFSMGIYSSRRTGKTVFTRYILSKIHHFYSQCHIFSGTAGLQDIYDFCPAKNIYNGFDDGLLKEIVDKQIEYIQKERARRPAGEKGDDYKKNLKHILIILDDVIDDKSTKYSRTLNEIFTKGRHSNIAIIFLSQSVVGITSNMRRNVDFAVSFNLKNHDDVKTFVTQYMSDRGIPEGTQLFKDITSKNYNAVICKNYVTSNNIEDRVFQLTAEPTTPDFVIGSLEEVPVERPAGSKRSSYKKTVQEPTIYTKYSLPNFKEESDEEETD